MKNGVMLAAVSTIESGAVAQVGRAEERQHEVRTGAGTPHQPSVCPKSSQ